MNETSAIYVDWYPELSFSFSFFLFERKLFCGSRMISLGFTSRKRVRNIVSTFILVRMLYFLCMPSLRAATSGVYLLFFYAGEYWFFMEEYQTLCMMAGTYDI